MERLARRTYSERGKPCGQLRAPPLPREHHQWTPLARALTAMGDQWTLLIAAELASGPKRPFELRTRLPGISAGVLDRHLQQMAEFGLISRKRYRELPPRVELQLTRAGAELAPIANELACWGIRHVWTEPHLHEQVDVSAILHMLPGMLTGERLPDGTTAVAANGTCFASGRAASRRSSPAAPGRPHGWPAGPMNGWTRWDRTAGTRRCGSPETNGSPSDC